MFALDKVRKFLHEDLKRVDTILQSKAKNDETVIKEVVEGIIKSGGKRVRAILTLLIYRIISCDISSKSEEKRLEEVDQVAIRLAASVELLHAATLLHDDVIDEASVRRGVKTANVLWGNTLTILTGDYLLSQAFNELVQIKNIQVLELIAQSASIISEGEIMQYNNLSNFNLSEKEYLRIITAKTAQLFSAACQAPAMLLNCSQLTLIAVKKLGTEIGTAFQIVDDCLDYSTNLAGKTGKLIGTDFKERKVTLPIIKLFNFLAPNDADRLQHYFSSARASINDLYLEEICKKMEEFNVLTLCKLDANKHINSAVKAVASFKDCEAKKCLMEMLDFVTARSF